MFASTAERVRRHTATEVNQQIERAAHERLEQVAATGPRAIERRKRELDREWDIERVLEAHFASVVLLGTFLGAKVHRGFFALPAIAAGFMLQHVVSGWCPPLPILRRMGVRTEKEIDLERQGLRALQRDFDILADEDIAVAEVIDTLDLATDGLGG